MSITFNVETLMTTTADSVEYTVMALHQATSNKKVLFSQDLSTVGDDTFTELGIALTKEGYIVGPSAALTGTITLVAVFDGTILTGELSSGSVTLRDTHEDANA